MTKVDIISGFLGAGKTTLIKKLLKEALVGEQVVLIENEFGEIGIDGGFLQESGIEIREMNSGCICCSLVGDFTTSLREVITTYHPDRVIIEPSGVGALSDVIVAVQKGMEGQIDVVMNSTAAVVDVQKCKLYMKNFGEFFGNQIQSAGTVILSRTGICKPEKMDMAIELIRELNDQATIITTDWSKIEGRQILDTMEKTGNLADDLLKEMMEEHEEHEHEHEHEHHHHHHDENGVCSCGHHHEHEHHHHEHEHEHEHHHHYNEEGVCSCGHHHADHEQHHHHADDVFTSWGFETHKAFSVSQLEEIMEKLGDSDTYGMILRSKGMVACTDGEGWLYFDMVPEEHEIREGSAQVTGKICVIGSGIHEHELEELFGVKH